MSNDFDDVAFGALLVVACEHIAASGFPLIKELDDLPIGLQRTLTNEADGIVRRWRGWCSRLVLTCPACGIPFVRTRRQRFCSTKCQSRAYMRDWRAKNRAGR